MRLTRQAGRRAPTLTLFSLVLFLVLALPACGNSDSSAAGPTNVPANPCATPNSTYLQTFTEVSGNCGPIPSVITNINADGTITQTTPINCASVTQSGCTARDTDCAWSASGFSYSETFETTFMQDGSSATGLLTLSGMGNGQICSETYNISMVRQ
jgi:hypothetical protein